MYTNILVPYDGSEPASHALAEAIEMATGDAPVSITVIQVANTGDFDRSTLEVAARMAGLSESDGAKLKALSDSYIDANREHVQEEVSKFFEGLPENVNVKIVVKRGAPRDVIVQYAEDNDIDCIVMGRRGISGIRAALGSVSTAVLRGTDLPVLVVK